jgi:two-component system, OmpR family, sensor histidine kinase SaeS
MLTTQPRTSQSPLVTASARGGDGRWSGLLGAVARWLVAWVVAFGLTIGLVAATLHPPTSHLEGLALYLLVGGALSLLTAVGLHAATWTGRFSGVRLRFAVPVVLTAVVISVNVLIVAHQMFLAEPDTVLVLAILVFGTVLAVTVSTSLAGATASALLQLEASARKIAAGEYSVRVGDEELGGGAELARLGRWFNQMAASVEDAFDRQRRAERERRQLVAALSHDLRTPLASIRAMVEAITDGVVTEPGTVERYHRTMRGEVRHLTSLIDDLFDLARLEALPDASTGLHREVVALEDVISDTLEAMQEQANLQGLALSGRIEGDLPPVKVDARQIHRVLTNLVQNSLSHTRTGGHIAIRACWVHLAEAGGTPHITVQVVDDGEGIADADLPHVFEPTFRGERSRRRDSAGEAAAVGAREPRATGAGLGLAIARGLVEAHGGRLTAESPLTPASAALLGDGAAPDTLLGPGTCLTVTLPL